MLVNYLYLFIAATVASAAYVSKDAPKVITLPLEHQSGVIQKRDGSAFSNDLDAYGTTIFTTIYVGSNEDRVKLQIDTGSWLTHIIDTQGICDHCDGNGRYNSSASTTVQRLGKPYASYFRPGDYYKGESVIDIVNFGGVKFPFNFDDSTNSSGSINGLLGLARPPTNENQSFVFQAKKAGVIDKAAFSFITSNLDDSEGSLILGGYDAAKIDGDIHWT
ncbi:Aspartyl protease, putative (Secreted aspartyl protease, putative), partial [Candida maltosa Xu316]